ncbi:MAG: hypothetical protein RIK87_25525 [Fuerstiella sp.]
MKTSMNLCVVMSMLIVGVDPGSGRSGAVLADQAQKKETTSAVHVCPLYVWMNWGSYCSYYAQENGTCNSTNYDSTNCQLPPGDCNSSTNCVQTLLKDGQRVDRPDDPGTNGYGHNKPSPHERRKKHWLGQDKIPGSNHRPGADPWEYLSATERFAIKFANPAGGPPVFAQIVVVDIPETIINGRTYPALTVARGWEIHAPGGIPLQDPNATVQPGSGRPHAFGYSYTPKNGGDEIWINIITHHETAGHDH